MKMSPTLACVGALKANAETAAKARIAAVKARITSLRMSFPDSKCDDGLQTTPPDFRTGGAVPPVRIPNSASRHKYGPTERWGALTTAPTPWAASRARAGSARERHAGDTARGCRTGQHRAGLQPPAQAIEAQHLPALLAGHPRQLPVWIDRHWVSDRLQHRQVRRGI